MAQCENAGQSYAEAALPHFQCRLIGAKGRRKGATEDAEPSQGTNSQSEAILSFFVDPLHDFSLPDLPTALGARGVEQAALVRRALEAALVAQGATRLCGAPPRGPIERLMQTRLNSFLGGGKGRGKGGKRGDK